MSVDYETVVGLEVHAQLLSKTKLFCGCLADFGAPPNRHVCPVCLGLPGALPVPNRAALEMAATTGFALGCSVSPSSQFARKNYFYPDLAKGYQISQFEHPLNRGGEVQFSVGDEHKTVRLQRAHVEEDAAKNIHGEGADGVSLIDFNRAGVPLVEIVSEPDIRSGQEAEAYLKRLREILMFAGVNDGNLEQGSFRCDANVSVRPVGDSQLYTRVELKNINSFRFVRQAIEHEAARQIAVVTGGGSVVQETRTWNEGAGKTAPLRGKEEAHDYRYFPDPDLPPVVFSEEEFTVLRDKMPESADARRERWMQQGLTAYDAQVLTGHPRVADFVDSLLSLLGKSSSGKKARKAAANFVQSEALGHFELDGLRGVAPLAVEPLAELLEMLSEGEINRSQAKEVYAEMRRTGERPSEVAERKGLSQITSEDAIAEHVVQAIEKHPEQVQTFLSGKTQILGFLVGQVMKATQGRADPRAVSELLQKKLAADASSH